MTVPLTLAPPAAAQTVCEPGAARTGGCATPDGSVEVSATVTRDAPSTPDNRGGDGPAGEGRPPSPSSAAHPTTTGGLVGLTAGGLAWALLAARRKTMRHA